MSQRLQTSRAFVAALLLHALLLLLTWNQDLIGTPEEVPSEATRKEVRVVLEPGSESPETTLPQAYTSIPERQEVPEPPDDPDFLALRDSRAADSVAGGEEGASPLAEQTDEFSQVAISQDTGGSPGGVVVLPVPSGELGQAGESGETGEDGAGEPLPDGDLAAGEEAGGESLLAEGQAQEGGEEEGYPTPELADLLAQAAPSILDDRDGVPGDRGFDYDQASTSLDAGNLIEFGDFALSTVEWDFAPWLERFKQDFLPNWIPPYAYTHLRVIDGMTVLKIVVQPDGTVSELDVLETEGHESLHRASVSAMRATAPLASLPAHFPDPELVFTVKLLYSAREFPAPRSRPAVGQQRGSHQPRR